MYCPRYVAVHNIVDTPSEPTSIFPVSKKALQKLLGIKSEFVRPFHSLFFIYSFISFMHIATLLQQNQNI